MNQLLSAADKLFSLLPFNGDKTILSLAAKFALPIAVAHFPILIAIAPALDALADLGLAIGVSHKLVKASK